jgi:hypothetical protein
VFVRNKATQFTFMKIPLKHNRQKNGPYEEEDGDDVGKKEKKGKETHSEWIPLEKGYS